MAVDYGVNLVQGVEYDFLFIFYSNLYIYGLEIVEVQGWSGLWSKPCPRSGL